MKLQLDPWQKKFIETKGDKILCTGRQVGKTEICAMDCGEYAIKPDNPYPILMTAPTERQAFLLFDKTLRYLLENHPKMVIMKGVKRPTKTKIELKNGIKIYCLPTGAYGLGIRGITVGRSYEDENARVQPEIESAIAPMLLTTGGARIKLSTPAGAVGEFYNTWINKDGAYNSYTRFSIDTEKVITERKVSKTWTELQREGALRLIEQAKARMSKREYAQEFLGEFIEDLHRWFSDKLIAQTCVLKRRNTIVKDRNYYMGCDIARMGEDEGTIEILDKINKDMLEQVENIVTRKQLTTQTEDNIINQDNLYNCRMIYIDAGAGTLGVSVFDHLLRNPSTKRKVVAINNRTRPLDNEDRPSKTKLLKEDLYGNLLALMEQRKIKLLDDEDIIQSLRSIQYEYIMKQGEPTKLRIFGRKGEGGDHIAEGLIRAAWCIKDKSLNIWIM